MPDGVRPHVMFGELGVEFLLGGNLHQNEPVVAGIVNWSADDAHFGGRRPPLRQVSGLRGQDR